MAFLITSSCTPLAAAAPVRLQGAAGGTAATSRLLLLGSGLASGRIDVRRRAVLPAEPVLQVGGAGAASRARTRCTAGDQASDNFGSATFDTLVSKLECWRNDPPKNQEGFNEMKVTTSECLNLIRIMVENYGQIDPPLLLLEISYILGIFALLHYVISRRHNPRAPDAIAIEVAISRVKRLAQIYAMGAPGLKTPAGTDTEELDFW